MCLMLFPLKNIKSSEQDAGRHAGCKNFFRRRFMDETLAKQIERTLALLATRQGGELAMALTEVIKVTHRWREETTLGILSVDVAIDDILSAIEKGMRL